jgi:predicted dehydrogenase
MALNYGEACSMQQTAQEMGRTLGIAYYRRMYPKVNRAKELIAAGVIGPPVFAEATSHDWFHPVDGPRGWLIDPKRAGGGPLYDIGSHRIDLMNYLFGEPTRVTGLTSTLVQPTEVEDNATVLIEYKSRVRGLVDVRWHSRVPRDEFRIRGTDGEMDLTPLNGASLVYRGQEEHLPPHQNLHYPCVDNFVSAVLENEVLRSTGATALWTDWVTEQVALANPCH